MTALAVKPGLRAVTRPLRAVIYARKSNVDAKRKEKSVRDQLFEGREVAVARGYDVVRELSDDGKSASRHAKTGVRTDFIELLRMIEDGEVDVVIMAEQSRATRRLSVLGALIETCADHGVDLVLGGRDVDPTNPGDIVLMSVQGGMDAAESEKARDRTLRGMRGAARDGRPHGKNLYGYRRVYDPATGALRGVEIVEEEAAIIREITSRMSAGESMWAISKDLNARNVPTPYDAVAARQGREPKNAKWSTTQMRRVILNPAYIGTRVHLGEVAAEGAWPAIIDAGVQARLAARYPGSDTPEKFNRPGRVVHPLSGIARCGVCGARMRVLRNRGRYPAYVCVGNGHVARSKAPFEALVRKVVLALVTRPGFLAAVAKASENDAEVAEAWARVDELNARLAEVEKSVARGQMPAVRGGRIMTGLEAELEEAKQHANSLVLPFDVRDLVPGDLEARWDSLEPGQQRSIIDALVTITVYPVGRKSRSFVHEGVEIVPKA